MPRYQSYDKNKPNFIDPNMLPLLAPEARAQVDTVEPVLTDAEKAQVAWEQRKADLKIMWANRVNGADPRIADEARNLLDTIQMAVEDGISALAASGSSAPQKSVLDT